MCRNKNKKSIRVLKYRGHSSVKWMTFFVGLGIMGWKDLGPDFKHYLKIRNM
jgi:hypothetical protein